MARPARCGASAALAASTALLVLLAAGLLNALDQPQQPQQQPGGRIKVEGGWTEVRKGWPLEARDYFVATEKGHHFIEVHDLPKNLDANLRVSLEYYFSYKHARPVLTLIPCRSNIYVQDEEPSETWLRHEFEVDRSDCAVRNELAYNVLLHDAGDVFAWRLMTVKSAPPVGTEATSEPSTTSELTTTSELITTSEPSSTTSATEAPAAEKPDDLDDGKEISDLVDEELKSGKTETTASSTTTTPATTTTTTRPTPPTSTTTTTTTTTRAPPTTTTTTTTRAPSTTTSTTTTTTTTTRAPSTTSTTTTTTPAPTTTEWSKPTPKVEAASERDQAATERPLAGPTGDGQKKHGDWAVEKPRGGAAEESKRNELDEEDELYDDVPAQYKPAPRLRRSPAEATSDAKASGKGGAPPARLDERCRPSACDRHKFRMARFSALISGLPKLPAGSSLAGGAKKFYVNLKEQPPLRMRMESPGRPLSELDPCLKFQLFMDSATELELAIEESAEAGAAGAQGSKAGEERAKTTGSGNSTAAEQERAGAAKVERALEVIRRDATSAAAGGGGQWERFERCISDYMPKLAARDESDNSVSFLFKPRAAASGKAGKRPAPGQLAILVDSAPNQGGFLRQPHPLQSFLPDVKTLASARALERLWLVGPAHVAPNQRPTLELKGSRDGPERKLLISNIDDRRATFDITSRWLAIKDAELLEQPVLFVYRARQADWVERVEFQFQRAGDHLDDWLSQVTYEAPANKPSNANNSSASSSKPSSSSAATTNAGGVSTTTTTAAPPTETSAQKSAAAIDLPIRLKGVDSSEFRVRVRHYLKAEARRASHGAAHNPHAVDPFALENLGSRSLKLEVTALAFADACSYRPQYCFNNGACRPTGAAQAECLCLPGFSGALCQHKRPCEILYDGRTGAQACASLGARCVDALPVMRCEWPNDNYYQCQKLYKLNATTNHVELIKRDELDLVKNVGGSGGGGDNVSERLSDGRELSALPVEEQVGALRGIVNQQAKLIIILAVFLVSVVVFAIVLVASLVGRLRKSGKRLRATQGDIQQMVRRVSAATASSPPAGPPFASTSFGRAPAAFKQPGGYNNSAFDVE